MDQCNVANLVTFAFVVNDDLFVLILFSFLFFFNVHKFINVQYVAGTRNNSTMKSCRGKGWYVS